MNDNEIIKANDILSKFDFFGGQRAGRELWNEKPVDIQDEDIKNFSEDVAFLKDFINRQKAEKDSAWDLLKKRTEENIELQKLCDRQKAENERLLQKLQQAQSEAYREFAEKTLEKVKAAYFKEVNACYESGYADALTFVEDLIDEIKEELTEK